MSDTPVDNSAAPLDRDAIEAAAKDLAANMTAEDREGLLAWQALVEAVGAPAVRGTFMAMAAEPRGLSQRDAMAAVGAAFTKAEVGCYKVDFLSRKTGLPDHAYLVVDRCKRKHNFGGQLDKLKPHVSDEKWPEVIRHISMMVLIARRAYAHEAREHIDLVRQLTGRAAADPCDGLLDLQVDPANTTLYADKRLHNRVGVFVRLSSEVPHSSE